MLIRAFGPAGAAAGLEDRDGPALVALRQPAPHRALAQPLVLEGVELVEVGVAPDLLARVPAGLLGPFEPEGRARRRVEVPGHQLADPGVEPGPGVGDGRRGYVKRGSRHQMLGACSEHAPSKRQNLRWYYVSTVRNRAKTARISLAYAPAGPAVARHSVHPGASRRYLRRGLPPPRFRTPASDVRRALSRPDDAGAESRRPHRDDHPGDPDPGRRHPHHVDLEPPRPCRRSRAHAVGELRGARDRRAEDGLRRGTAPAHLQSARQTDEPRPAPPAQHDFVLPRPRRLRRDERYHRTPGVRDAREGSCRPTSRWWPRSRACSSSSRAASC